MTHSTCCKAPVTNSNPHEALIYHKCSKCKNICDIIIETPTPPPVPSEILSEIKQVVANLYWKAYFDGEHKKSNTKAQGETVKYLTALYTPTDKD